MCATPDIRRISCWVNTPALMSPNGTFMYQSISLSNTSSCGGIWGIRGAVLLAAPYTLGVGELKIRNSRFGPLAPSDPVLGATLRLTGSLTLLSP